MSDLHCRFCGTPLEHTFVDLGMSPFSNGFRERSQLREREVFYPLHTYVCSNCFLVQLEQFVTPERIFSDYAYFSSYSQSWLDHARQYVDMMTERFQLNAEKQVIEIASNDGYLLQYFRQKEIPVLGIEPAANVAEVAVNKGIPTEVTFFGTATAEQIAGKGKKADLLLGNNVLAHVPDINDFVAGMKIVLQPDGIITMEFPHLLQLIRQTQFDTIYHEHFSYLSLITVQRIFTHHELMIFDVEGLPTHGGSLRIFACHAKNKKFPVSARVENMLKLEQREGLRKVDTYKLFEKKVHHVKRALLSFLIETKNQGKTIAGYGAAAKGNTLLNYCGIREDFIDYVADRSPHKQGMYLPGTHIPVCRPEKIVETRPDYLLILPWNIKDELIEQLSHIRKWGGRFIIPIPTVEVLE